MTDTYLQQVERVFDTDMIPPLRARIIGPKLFSKNPKVKAKPGQSTVQVTTLGELGEALISWGIPQGDVKDMLTATVADKPVPDQSKQYQIPRNVYDAWKAGLYPIDSAIAASAGYVVGQKIDEILINGWKPDGTNYAVKGLLQAAGSTKKGAGFDTYGNARASVAGLLGVIEGNNALADAYNLLLNPVQWAELLASQSTTGIEEWDQVLKLLNLGNDSGPAQILSTTHVPAGTGVLSPVDPGRISIEVYELQAVENQLTVDPKLGKYSDVYGITAAKVLPHIRQPKAVGKMTDI